MGGLHSEVALQKRREQKSKEGAAANRKLILYCCSSCCAGERHRLPRRVLLPRHQEPAGRQELPLLLTFLEPLERHDLLAHVGEGKGESARRGGQGGEGEIMRASNSFC